MSQAQKEGKEEKPMKKRLLTVVCTLALVLSLVTVPASASETFFLGINDKIGRAHV